MNDHATLACRTAIRMKQAEIRLNERIISERLSPVPLFTRLGINTGDMIVGNMGTPNKMDYTIMGNSVNLAARLEGVNKQYETGGILISEHTRNKIGDEFLLRRLDRVRVVGLVTPLRLYELLAFESESTEADMEYVHEWERAIDLYEEKSFLEAQNVFLKLANTRSDDRVAQLYARRCEEFIANPPNNDWDGVFNLTHK
jgi:adenylate cyclase